MKSTQFAAAIVQLSRIVHVERQDLTQIFTDSHHCHTTGEVTDCLYQRYNVPIVLLSNTDKVIEGM